MAFQTFVIRNFIPEDMALRTIRHAFQMGMGLGEFSRGDLGVDLSCHKGNEENICGDESQNHHWMFIQTRINVLTRLPQISA
jgi:hypothetical protein